MRRSNRWLCSLAWTVLPFCPLALCAEQKVDPSKLLRGDRPGQQLVAAAKKLKLEDVKAALARNPSILARVFALEITESGRASSASALILDTDLVRQKTDVGKTALMYAAEFGQVSALEALLRGGAAIDERMSALVTRTITFRGPYAVSSSTSSEMVEGVGNNALSLAVLNGRYDAARVLIERGAGPSMCVTYADGGVSAAPGTPDFLLKASDFHVVTAAAAPIRALAEASKDRRFAGLFGSAKTGGPERPLYLGCAGDAGALVISPHDAYLAVASGPSEATPDILIWSLPEGKFLKRIRGEFKKNLVFSPDSKLIAVTTPKGFALVDVTTGNVAKEFVTPNNNDLDFSTDGAFLASFRWGAGNAIELWSVQGGGLKQTLSTPNADYYRVAFGPSLLAAYSRPGGARLGRIDVWQWSSGAEPAVRTIPLGPKEEIWALTVTRQGDILAVMPSGDSLHLRGYPLKEDTPPWTKPLPIPGRNYFIDISPNREWALFNGKGEAGEAFHLVSLPEGKLVRTVRDQERWWGSTVSSDGLTFASKNRTDFKLWVRTAR